MDQDIQNSEKSKPPLPFSDPNATELAKTDKINSRKYHKNQKKQEGWRTAVGTVALLAVALILAFFINQFILQPYEVDGSSMEPTLSNHNRLIVLKTSKTWAKIQGNDYLPERGTIIIFKKPNNEDVQLIKRVIALPGEKVTIKNGKVTVFNEDNPNGFNPDEAPYGKDLATVTGENTKTVGEGEVFVMGDNRNPGGSLDSRSSEVGNVPLKNIVGRLGLRIYPVNKIQTF